MHILVVGRTLPDNKNSAYGVFEFEQARHLNKKTKTGFLFVNTSSLKTLRKIEKINKNIKDVDVVGSYFPIKGLPTILYNKIRARLFIESFNNYTSLYGVPDIVHIHFPLLVLNTDIISFLKSQKVKIAMTEHWTKIQYNQLSLEQITLLKELIKIADIFITVSKELKNSINNLTKTDNDIKVIPNMVDDTFYKIPISDKINKKFIFTYIGRLVKVKRVDYLIEAFKEIFGNNDNVELQIIGDGTMMNKLKKQSSGTDNITFTGNLDRNELAHELSKSSSFVTASNFETFGVPVIEAMSLGIPVLCSEDIPAAIYVNDKNGMLFNPNKLLDLSNKLGKMYSEIDSFSSEEIRNTSYDKFSSNAVTNMLLNLYTASI
ncbi:glycosyltransferase family 4 protein [Aerococcus urinaeequi]|uniref:glycosyltransferase family 4 protein n=1 Tax=Aerococcus urinaeequi TaxID=51665 RepID=UPI003D6A48AE